MCTQKLSQFTLISFQPKYDFLTNSTIWIGWNSDECLCWYNISQCCPKHCYIYAWMIWTLLTLIVTLLTLIGFMDKVSILSFSHSSKFSAERKKVIWAWKYMRVSTLKDDRILFFFFILLTHTLSKDCLMLNMASLVKLYQPCFWQIDTFFYLHSWTTNIVKLLLVASVINCFLVNSLVSVSVKKKKNI